MTRMMPILDVERERTLNRALKRADWRFLLPDPCPVFSVCFAEGRIREAVELISQLTADPAHEPNTRFDLAVAVDPDPEVLLEAFARLRPGGACYTEWTGVSATAEHAVRNLANAGFQDTRVYWAWPSPENCRAWIPLDEPAAAAGYFDRENRAAHGPARRLAWRTRQTTAQIRQRLGLTRQVSAVSTKPTGAPAPPASDEQRVSLLQIIQRRWSDWGLGAPPRRLSCLMQTGGPRSISKVVTFVYADRDRDPRIVVKAARVPEAARSLAREASVLDALQTSPVRTIDGIPRLLLFDRDPVHTTLCETAVTGIAISSTLARARYENIAEIATTWLIGFEQASRRAVAGTGWRAARSAMLERFARICGPSVEPALVDELRARLGYGGPPFFSWEHRDYSPWNVLLHRGSQLAVLDWESSEMHGCAGVDLIYFLSYLAFYHAGLMGTRFSRPSMSSFRRAYREAWNASTSTGRINHQCLSSYCRGLGIEPDEFPALRAMTWLTHAVTAYERRAADGSDSTSRDTLRHSLLLNLLEEECAHRIFRSAQ